MEARAEAIRRAKEVLRSELDSGRESLEQRCARLGLPAPADGALSLPLFGSPARLDIASLALTGASGEARSQADEILFFHYLAYEGGVTEGSGTAAELISFRDLTGGAFYWEPFRSRTCLPIIKRYASDLAGLKAALDRFEWRELPIGDFGARVHAMGRLFVSLVYYAAEEGMETDIVVLFDPAMKRIFQAEDAAAVASRICIGLL